MATKQQKQKKQLERVIALRRHVERSVPPTSGVTIHFTLEELGHMQDWLELGYKPDHTQISNELVIWFTVCCKVLLASGKTPRYEELPPAPKQKRKE
jgi:hypothetical protein